MEEIEVNFKDVKVGDYIKAVIENSPTSWDTTYFKVEKIDNDNDEIDLETTVWIDFLNGKFVKVDRGELGRTALSQDWKDNDGKGITLYNLSEKKFYNKLGKYIVIGSL